MVLNSLLSVLNNRLKNLYTTWSICMLWYSFFGRDQYHYYFCCGSVLVSAEEWYAARKMFRSIGERDAAMYHSYLNIFLTNCDTIIGTQAHSLA